MSNSIHILQEMLSLHQQGIDFVCVTLLDVIGSAPQNIGAKMLVSTRGLESGTIGGGKIEKTCLAKAHELLTDSDKQMLHAIQYVEWNLQKDIGMTCGGLVRVSFELYSTNQWSIAVFGAGHVAQALVPILCALPCQVTCIDSRSEWLERLPDRSNLKTICLEQPADYIAHLSDHHFIVSMTMGHAFDVPILKAALDRQSSTGNRFPYIGVIGSPAKAGVIRRDLSKQNCDPEMIADIICPMGFAIGSNHPAEIAISIVAQLLQFRDQVVGNGKWQQAAYQKANQ